MNHLFSPFVSRRHRAVTKKLRVFINPSYHHRSESLKRELAIFACNSFLKELRQPHLRLGFLKKFNENGAVLNRNTGHSGRQITVTTEQTFQIVGQVLEDNPSVSS